MLKLQVILGEVSFHQKMMLLVSAEAQLRSQPYRCGHCSSQGTTWGIDRFLHVGKEFKKSGKVNGVWGISRNTVTASSPRLQVKGKLQSMLGKARHAVE